MGVGLVGVLLMCVCVSVVVPCMLMFVYRVLVFAICFCALECVVVLAVVDLGWLGCCLWRVWIGVCMVRSLSVVLLSFMSLVDGCVYCAMVLPLRIGNVCSLVSLHCRFLELRVCSYIQIYVSGFVVAIGPCWCVGVCMWLSLRSVVFVVRIVVSCCCECVLCCRCVLVLCVMCGFDGLLYLCVVLFAVVVSWWLLVSLVGLLCWKCGCYWYGRCCWPAGCVMIGVVGSPMWLLHCCETRCVSFLFAGREAWLVCGQTRTPTTTVTP